MVFIYMVKGYVRERIYGVQICIHAVAGQSGLLAGQADSPGWWSDNPGC